MREIEFRGLNKERKWVMWDCFGNLISKEKVVLGREIKSEYDIDEKTVGQYTGLKDKDGRKIFEGDKVAVQDDDEKTGVVVWDLEELEYGIDVENVQLKMGCFYSGDLEIIGNIHEMEA